MAKPGIRKQRVVVFAFKRPRNQHERLQPQGGRSLRAREQIRGRGRRAPGERNGGVHHLPEQRSGAGSPHAFHQSAAGGGRENCPPGRLPGRNRIPARVKLRLAASVFVAVLLPLLIAGCGGEHKQARVHVPSPPPISQSHPQAIPAAPEPAPEKKESARKEVQRKEEGKVEGKEEEQEKDLLSVPPGARPVFIETGLSSWYGWPYHNCPSTNGKIYDMNDMTAAHRTLPLGSIVRVT